MPNPITAASPRRGYRLVDSQATKESNDCVRDKLESLVPVKDFKNLPTYFFCSSKVSSKDTNILGRSLNTGQLIRGVE